MIAGTFCFEVVSLCWLQQDMLLLVYWHVPHPRPRVAKQRESVATVRGRCAGIGGAGSQSESGPRTGEEASRERRNVQQQLPVTELASLGIGGLA